MFQTYTSVDALHLFGYLTETLDYSGRVDFAQESVVTGLTLGLCHQMLPAGVT